MQKTSTDLVSETSNHLQASDPERRQFLIRSAAGGGIMVGMAWCGLGQGNLAHAQLATTQNNVNTWVIIGSDETITLQVPVTELGQGTSTGLAQIAADELCVAWGKIKVVHAPVDPAHGGSNASIYGRFTGGSLGIRLFSPTMRQAAANARQLLLMAAANAWGVDAATCKPALGVISTTSGTARTLTYGAVAAAAAKLALAANVPLNQFPAVFTGKSAKRLDIPAKVDGSAKFGIDTFMPGMVFATVKHCPTQGGTVGALGSSPAGVIATVKVGGIGAAGTPGYRAPNGIAVVPVTTWDAMRAVSRVNVNWTLPTDLNAIDSAAISARATDLMRNGTPLVAESINSANVALGLASGPVITAEYQVPYLAHAALEPLSCTVRFTPGMPNTPARCEVWAPTQVPDAAYQTATSLCPPGTVITLVNTLAGGGFGRKLELDYIIEAIQVAFACPGKPVKLTWSREEDFTNDHYRPMAMTAIQAAASPSTGKITAWKNRIVTPSIAVAKGGNPALVDSSAVEGAVALPYAMTAKLVEFVRHDATIPVGYIRSVGFTFKTFAVECAMDELAAAIGWDPIQFRLANLADPRMTNVLKTLKTLANWGVPARGQSQGVAIMHGFGSYVGQVAELAVDATGGVRISKVTAVIDCGVVINPDAVKAQIEGAISQAIGVTLYAQQTFVKGVAQARNYNRYRFVKLQDMPQVVVQIIANGDPVGGVGEPGIPCVAPAIANAYARFAGATRHRSLPFYLGSTMSDL